MERKKKKPSLRTQITKLKKELAQKSADLSYWANQVAEYETALKTARANKETEAQRFQAERKKDQTSLVFAAEETAAARKELAGTRLALQEALAVLQPNWALIYALHQETEDRVAPDMIRHFVDGLSFSYAHLFDADRDTACDALMCALGKVHERRSRNFWQTSPTAED
ncbi:MAG: hypothetical protein AAB608_01500 [Patescibacteria group bacterium]